MKGIPRQYSLIKLMPEYKKWLLDNVQGNSDLLGNDTFVFLGEIPNMREHCIVCAKESGKILTGYHVGNFIELNEDEV